MSVEFIPPLLQSNLAISVEWHATLQRITVESKDLWEVCNFLWRDPACYFDQLSCLTAIDNGPEKGTLELIYTLYSIPHHLTLHVQVVLPRLVEENQLPSVASLVTIWKTADWHEREAFDLVGVNFEGHPDLRRILLPEDWNGHPLRKDYVEQEKYHGIQVKY
jgi:NADH-quinone oxidoreductase subunit C